MQFQVIRINEKRLIRFAYKLEVLKDALSGQTKTVQSSWEETEVGRASYHYRVSAGRHSSKLRTGHGYYVSFRDGEASYRSYLVDPALLVYYQKMEKAS